MGQVNLNVPMTWRECREHVASWPWNRALAFKLTWVMGWHAGKVLQWAGRIIHLLLGA